MKINVDSVSSAKRPFYEWKQKKILEKIAREQKIEEEKEKEKSK
jgi:hypothetical protein